MLGFSGLHPTTCLLQYSLRITEFQFDLVRYSSKSKTSPHARPTHIIIRSKMIITSACRRSRHTRSPPCFVALASKHGSAEMRRHRWHRVDLSFPTSLSMTPSDTPTERYPSRDPLGRVACVCCCPGHHCATSHHLGSDTAGMGSKLAATRRSQAQGCSQL
jgi:hypothetical protein